MEVVHQSVLTEEVLDLLAPGPNDQLVVDATVGEGGHSACFLQQFPNVRVIGIDADRIMLERARVRLAEFEGRVELVHQWFDSYFQSRGPDIRPDRILMDLGVSMYHFTKAERGFSFREDELLDMRLDGDDPPAEWTPGGGSPSAPRETAADLVNTLPESDLADIIFQYGEERLSRRIAAAICRERDKSPLTTSAQLADIIRGAVPASYRHSRIHPATRTFQALRIAVNSELDRVRRVIPHALSCLPISGRLGIISFHSLEDRIVKHTFRDVAAEGEFRVVTRKPVIATESERDRNPASRSAKFRVIERSPDGSGSGQAVAR